MTVSGANGVSVIGNVQADLIVDCAELPPPGTERLVEDMRIRAAGNGGNAALVLAHLGLPPDLVGCVGDDPFGKMVLSQLRAAGLRDGVVTLSEIRTGLSVAFEAEGRDRSFLTLLGSMAAFKASMVSQKSLESGLVLFCGYFNLPSMRGAATRALLEKARDSGGVTLFDCGWDPDGWSEETRHEVLDLLPCVDIFLPNKVEVQELSGFSGDPLRAAHKLQKLSGGWIVVKLGSDGCIASGPKGETHRAQAPPVSLSDSTGAGDAFNAGLLHSISKGEEMLEALDFATRVASTVVSRPSSNRYPTFSEVLPSATRS